MAFGARIIPESTIKIPTLAYVFDDPFFPSVLLKFIKLSHERKGSYGTEDESRVCLPESVT